MTEESTEKEISIEEYLLFVKRRLEQTNYRAEEKLTRIDDLSEVIFTARRNFRAGKKP